MKLKCGVSMYIFLQHIFPVLNILIFTSLHTFSIFIISLVILLNVKDAQKSYSRDTVPSSVNSHLLTNNAHS